MELKKKKEKIKIYSKGGKLTYCRENFLINYTKNSCSLFFNIKFFIMYKIDTKKKFVSNNFNFFSFSFSQMWSFLSNFNQSFNFTNIFFSFFCIDSHPIPWKKRLKCKKNYVCEYRYWFEFRLMMFRQLPLQNHWYDY